MERDPVYSLNSAFLLYRQEMDQKLVRWINYELCGPYSVFRFIEMQLLSESALLLKKIQLQIAFHS